MAFYLPTKLVNNFMGRRNKAIHKKNLGRTRKSIQGSQFLLFQAKSTKITFPLQLYQVSRGKLNYSPKGNFLYRPRFQPTTLAYNLRPPSFLFLFVPFSVSERLGSRHCFRLVFGTFECWAIVVGSV